MSRKIEDDPEQEHEVTVTLHLTTYGRQKHVDSLVAEILTESVTKGRHVLSASLNGENVTDRYHDGKGRRWDHPKFNGYFPSIED